MAIRVNSGTRKKIQYATKNDIAWFSLWKAFGQLLVL
jgi:hypothetical protein